MLTLRTRFESLIEILYFERFLKITSRRFFWTCLRNLRET